MPEGKLSLIDLDQEIEGYRRFLSCWVWQGEDLTYIVDPGPRSTVDHLIASLKELGVTRLDYVLLTHIHLDHGGCVAEILKAFPGAKLYCHPSGVKHMVEPARLWKGSQMVLKEVAEVYLEPRPVPADAVVGADELEARGIKAVMTPGHAVHHVSFVHDEILYVGEAFGIFLELNGEHPYIRPATPPRFFLEQAVGSIELLEQLDPEPKITAFAHHGKAQGARRFAREAKDQLNRWVDAIRELIAEGVPVDGLEPRLFDVLMDTDPLYGRHNFDRLDPDIKNRERHFLQNTIDGMVGYLEADNRNS